MTDRIKELERELELLTEIYELYKKIDELGGNKGIPYYPIYPTYPQYPTYPYNPWTKTFPHPQIPTQTKDHTEGWETSMDINPWR